MQQMDEQQVRTIRTDKEATPRTLEQTSPDVSRKTCHTVPFSWIVPAVLLPGLGLSCVLAATGGFIADDWGLVYIDVLSGRPFTGFADRLGHWLSYNVSIRPVYALLLALHTSLFGEHYAAYVIANQLVWAAGLAVFGLVAAREANAPFPGLAFVLLAFPCLTAQATFFSPATMFCSPWAVLFSGLGILAIQSSLSDSRRAPFILGWLGLVLACLTYEVALSFVALAGLYCLVRLRPWRDHMGDLAWRLALLALLPVLLTAYQTYGVSLFTDSYTRLAADLPAEPVSLLIDYLIVTTHNLARLLVGAPFAAGGLGFSHLGALALLGPALWTLARATKPCSDQPSRALGLLVPALGAFFLTSALFLLSTYVPIITGYESRTMVSSWVCFCLVMAVLLDCFRRRFSRATLLFVCLMATAFYLCQAVLIEDNARGRQLRQNVAEAFVKAAVQAELPDNATVLCLVPTTTRPNINDMPIFFSTWDTLTILRLALAPVGKTIAGAAPLSCDCLTNRVVDRAMSRDQRLKAGYATLYLFDYDPWRGRERLVRVPNTQTMAVLAAEARDYCHIEPPLWRGLKKCLRTLRETIESFWTAK